MNFKPITVLQLCEHFGNNQSSFHGVARSFELWIPAFDRNRFRVILCSRHGAIQSAEGRFRAVGIQPLYLGYGKFDPRNLFKLMKIISRERVDIIHTHGYGACLWGRIAGMLMGRPVIVHERCNYRTVPIFMRPVEWLLGPSTRHAFAVSESTRQFTVDKRYIPSSVVKVLYSGIPLDGIPKADPEWIAACRHEQNQKTGDHVLGIVGRIEAHKGHIDAFKALQLIIKELPDTCIWIVGDGSYQNVLHAWVKENGLSGRVKFLGYRADVLKVIQCFDLQVFPSHQEGTPNTLYEAMAIGNIPVASTADGQGEILEDEKTALMFEPGDCQRMARSVIRLLQDRNLCESIRRNVLERIKDFDMNRTIAVLESAYEQIAEGRRR